jgi:hypothetical protein
MAKHLLRILKKIKGRSPDELRVRLGQALAAYGERAGWSSQARLPCDEALFRMLDASRISGRTLSAESLLAHFRTRTVPRFFAAFDNQEKTVHLLRETLGPHAEKGVIERARRLSAGHFDLLGLHDLHFGEPVDWHLEPVSGKRASLVHWSRIDFLNAAQVGDNKIVWELNRHQHFLTLGRAYWYTRDERFAQTFVAHLSGWMNQNPPKLGINWVSSLEIAFRAISWLWSFYFFKNSPLLTPPLFLRAWKFLYLHARHLETYLSTYFSPNTHLTGEALGLYYLGTLLPEFRRAASWRSSGKRILLRELHRHVQPDGVYFEQSSYYQRYTTDFYAHLYILSRLNGEPAGPDLEVKYAALLDHLVHLTRPDGSTPLFGDDDGGRFVPLDEREANDFRAALSTGAVALARPDYKYVAGEPAEETLWLLGDEGRRAYDRLDPRPPLHDSRAFSDGGYYVMRDGWARDSNYLLVDCGPHGILNCGHAHADVLSLELAAGGRTLLVDPGTYTYTGSPELRDSFRSAGAHNTLTIDDQSSSVPDRTFSWKNVARARPLCWTSHKRFDYFSGTHDGYARLATPAAHRRSILFLKRNYWIVRDRVQTNGAHRYDLHFHFAADANPIIETEAGVMAVRERKHDQPGLEILAFGGGGVWRREDGWVSTCYGARSPASVLVFSTRGASNQEFVTFLVPRAAQALKAQIQEIEARGGRAFEVWDGKVRDVLLLGTGFRVEAAPIVSDFEWTWARLAPDPGKPSELVLLSGSFLSLGGREIFRAAGRASFLVIRCLGEQAIVETDVCGDLNLQPLGASRITLNGEAIPVKREGAQRVAAGLHADGGGSAAGRGTSRDQGACLISWDPDVS